MQKTNSQLRAEFRVAFAEFANHWSRQLAQGEVIAKHHVFIPIKTLDASWTAESAIPWKEIFWNIVADAAYDALKWGVKHVVVVDDAPSPVPIDTGSPPDAGVPGGVPWGGPSSET